MKEIVRLINAAGALLQNAINRGETTLDSDAIANRTPVELAKYPADDDGFWYHDWFELKDAIAELRAAIKEADEEVSGI